MSNEVLNSHCDECHNILTTVDMRNALTENLVKGTTAAVSVVKELEKSLSVNKIEQFSSLPQLRVRRFWPKGLEML